MAGKACPAQLSESQAATCVAGAAVFSEVDEAPGAGAALGDLAGSMMAWGSAGGGWASAGGVASGPEDAAAASAVEGCVQAGIWAAGAEVCGEVCGEVTGQVRVPAVWVVAASGPEPVGAGGGAGGASWETVAGGSAEAAQAGG
jgi:hypothetical protein